MYVSDNQGANGASTVDWAETGEGKLLTNALVDFGRKNVSAVAIMLGTNDSKPWINTSPTDYQTNLQFIIDQLKGIGIEKIILNQPPAIQPNAGGFPDPTDENALLVEYQTSLSNLAAADPTHVFMGDQTAFSVFQAHAEYFQSADGIHPNDDGAVILAGLWEAAYPV